MIESLSIRNFKVLREVDVRLRPLTVIVGPNSSGKSSVLQTLSWLTEMVRDLGARYLPPMYLSRVPLGNLSFYCAGHFQEEPFELSFTRTPEEPWKLKGFTQYPFREAHILKLDPKKLANPSPLKEEALILPSDGEGLASILAGMSLEYPDRFQRIVALLRKIVPAVKAIRIRRKKITDEVTGLEILFDLESGEGFPAEVISEGTLLALGILTVLSTTNAPHLVLVDDLERGLHPRALKDLVQALRSLQESEPSLQIVATSHSPYLLDFLKAEEVLLTSLDNDGYSVIGSLTDHPEYERWKGMMAPGEFWSTVGEDWITKGNKATA